MANLPSLQSISRQLLLFSSIALICTGIAIAPAQSTEEEGFSQDGIPGKVVPGGTNFVS